MRTTEVALTGPATRRRRRPVLALLVGWLAACGGSEPPPQAPVALGPHDGRELPPADTGRVAVGDPAPDFTLASYDDGALTLSNYRGQKDVILVFYRGHW